MARVIPMAQRDQREHLSDRFFRGTAASYDRTVRWTTYGLDRRWKQRMVAKLPTDCSRVLDLACGTGILLDMLHTHAPDAALVGVDFTQEYLDLALQRFEGRALDLTLLHSNAEQMELTGEFDGVVSSYLPKYVNALHLFERFHEHVRPGSRVVFHDFGRPHAFARWVWYAHMSLLRYVGLRLFPQWRESFGPDLAAVIHRSRWQDSFEATFRHFGYKDVRVEKLTHRAAYLVSGTRTTRPVRAFPAHIQRDIDRSA